MRPQLLVLGAALLFTACGGGVKGTYVGTIGSDDCLYGPIMMGTLCKGGQRTATGK